jgi:alpha,alpha-trehalase
MALGNADVKVSAGYSQNVIGFGWTNGVYLKMEEILHRAKAKAAPAAATEKAK